MNGKEAEDLAQVLQDIQRILRDQICDFLDQRGIPFGQIAILRQLGEADGLTVSELGRRLGQSKGYISVLVEQLQQEGLVRKEPDPADQRLLRLYLTEKATAARVKLLQEYRQFLATLLSDLPVAEARAITDVLQRLRASLASRSGRATGRND